MHAAGPVVSRRFASRQARRAAVFVTVLAVAGATVAGGAAAGAAPADTDGEAMVAVAHTTQPGMSSSTYEQTPPGTYRAVLTLTAI
jgi:hypothetical protein